MMVKHQLEIEPIDENSVNDSGLQDISAHSGRALSLGSSYGGRSLSLGSLREVGFTGDRTNSFNVSVSSRSNDGSSTSGHEFSVGSWGTGSTCTGIRSFQLVRPPLSTLQSPHDVTSTKRLNTSFSLSPVIKLRSHAKFDTYASAVHQPYSFLDKRQIFSVESQDSQQTGLT